MDGLIQKANVLIEALPYIRKFFGRTFVVKYGGNAMTDPELKRSVILDLVLLKFIGINPVIVHGGGPEINGLLKRLGMEATFVNGLRVTDAPTMEVVQMVLIGKVNKELVSLIDQSGGRAVGLSGLDGHLIEALPLDPGLGYVGRVGRINAQLLHLLSREGYIPVVSSVGLGPDGHAYNINADTVAGELAVALEAEKLIMLTDVEGIFARRGDPASLISSLPVARARALIAAGEIDGGMIPKVEACIRAVEGGVGRTHIIDGRLLHSMLLEIFT
ncbi:MAG: acetylglutamate kinase, partial [Bacillota bacterium]|nr:acetylglutamate kinase [Bacillota bacterium]